jgi:hypothetical protein
MRRSSALIWLVPLIAVLVVITAGAGLFATGGSGPFTFTTLHGDSVQMDGRGIYKNDTLLAGAGFRGTDAISLLVALPLLLIAYRSTLRGSQNGWIVLIGALFFFLYNGASLTLSAAFNPLFLVYTALFSAGLYATITALATFDLPALVNRVQPGFPHRRLAIFTFVAGIGTLLIWLSDLIGPLLSGTFPATLGPYTTMYTHGFDSAVITPAAVLTGIFLLQRKPLGYLLVAPVLILCTLIGVVVIGQTISQTLAGLVFPIGVYIGMIGSWIVMGAFAVGLTRSYFRHLA